MREVQTLIHRPRMLLKGEMIVRAQRAEVLACYSPHIKYRIFFRTKYVRRTVRVLNDSLNIITVVEISSIGSPPDTP